PALRLNPALSRPPKAVCRAWRAGPAARNAEHTIACAVRVGRRAVVAVRLVSSRGPSSDPAARRAVVSARRADGGARHAVSPRPRAEQRARRAVLFPRLAASGGRHADFFAPRADLFRWRAVLLGRHANKFHRLKLSLFCVLKRGSRATTGTCVTS